MASTGSGAVMGTCLYCVILFVSADKLHLDNPQLVRHGDDQPIVIAFDVENNPAVLHLAPQTRVPIPRDFSRNR